MCMGEFFKPWPHTVKSSERQYVYGIVNVTYGIFNTVYRVGGT